MQKQVTQSPPPKKNLFLIFIFLIQGVAALLPWNALVSIPDFFNFKLRGSSYQTAYDTASLASFMTMNFLTTSALLLPMSKRTTSILSLSAYVLVSIVFTFLLGTAIANQVNAAAFFFATIFGIIVLGASTAIIQMYLFSFSSRLAPIYSTAMLVGQAVSGFFVSFCGFMLSVASYSSNARTPEEKDRQSKEKGIIYFSIVVATLILATVLVFVLPKLVAKEEVAQSLRSVESSSPRIAPDHDELTTTEGSNSTTEIGSSLNQEEAQPKLGFLGIFKAIWFYAINIFLGFFITLSVFPGLTFPLKKQPPANETNEIILKLAQSVYTSSLIMVFNLFDIVGRFVPMASSAILRRLKQKETPSNLFLAIFSACRLAFIPLFFFCAFNNKRPTIPTLFNNDWVPYILLALLPTTGGAVAAWTFVAAPQVLVNDTSSTEHLLTNNGTSSRFTHGSGKRPLAPAEKSMSGRIMNFSMLLGITLGVIFNIALKYAVISGN